MRIKLSKRGVVALIMGMIAGFAVMLSSCRNENRKHKLIIVPNSEMLLAREISVDSFNMISVSEVEVWSDGRKFKVYGKEIVPRLR